MKHRARKRWGQHFLADTNLLHKLIRLIEPTRDDSILEIGPGGGALTELLAPEVREIVGIEIDSELFDRLRQRRDLPNCHFINDDFLKIDLSKLQLASESVRIVGNLPYNITSPILFKLITEALSWRDGHFMVQREVAKRMVAVAGSKAYGRLTVNLQAAAKVHLVLTVPPEVFVPKPRVDSAVVKVVPKESPMSTTESESLQKLTRLAFGQRRKMLRNSLGTLKIDGSVLDLSLRPEHVAVEEFVALARWLERRDAIKSGSFS